LAYAFHRDVGEPDHFRLKTRSGAMMIDFGIFNYLTEIKRVGLQENQKIRRIFFPKNSWVSDSCSKTP